MPTAKCQQEPARLEDSRRFVNVNHFAKVFHIQARKSIRKRHVTLDAKRICCRSKVYGKLVRILICFALILMIIVLCRN